jgi:hypothetical protein
MEQIIGTPCSVDNKNEWSYTSIPLIFLRSLHRDSFTLPELMICLLLTPLRALPSSLDLPL